MRAGRLQTRRYKIRKSRRRALLIGLILGLGLFFAFREGVLSLPESPLLPLGGDHPAQEDAWDQRIVSLPAGRWYALTVGAYGDRSAALAAGDAFRARGAGGYVWEQGDDHQVLAAAYPSRGDAQKVQQQLREGHGLETWQEEIAWPEIQMQVKGRKAQLDALADALTGLCQLPDQLFALSQALDQRTLDPSDARQAFSSYRETLSALGNNLESRFSAAPPASVSQLREDLRFLSDALLTAQNTGGTTALGGQTKYCQLAALCRLRALAALIAQ